MQSKDVAVIPRFFFPGGAPIPEPIQIAMQSKLDQCFTAHPEGLTVPAVKDLVREVHSPALTLHRQKYCDIFCSPANA